MCTLTFVASQNKFIITHNRDEKTLRPSAIEPQNYLVNNKVILFPKDSKAGGTWFSVSQKGTVLVLLNGGEEKHLVQSSYRKSRGLIVLDLISSKLVFNEWNLIDLKDIEPFTLMLFENLKLYQLRWSGTEKSKLDLDKNKAYIWSSATLYSNEIRGKRAKWFELFLEKNTVSNESDLINFHRNTEPENNENGLIINRNNELQTISITQAIIEENKIITKYFDLILKTDFVTTLLTI